MPSNATRTATRPSASASGWPIRRTPRWVWLAGAALLAVAVVVALVHRPSQSERASDMRGFLHDVTADIESCAGGVGETLTALRDVQAEHPRNPADVSAAISLADQGAANCSPANNQSLDDLEGYQVTESLYSFGLASGVTNLVNWAAPHAMQVETDIASVLTARTPQATSRAQAALSAALAGLDATRAAVDRPINKAIKSLRMHAAPPRLPG